MAVEKTYLAEKGLQLEIKKGVEAIKTAVDAGTIDKTPRRQVFTTSGKWVAPTGVTRVLLTGGGGGGGGSSFTGSPTVGTSGGITSFGILLSLSGGTGGVSDANQNNGKGGLPGGLGGSGGGVLISVNNIGSANADGGSAGPYKGGVSAKYLEPSNTKNGGYCSGGGACAPNGAAGAGGSGDFVIDYPINVTPGTTYDITIGAGGVGSTSGGAHAGNGGSGILTIEWWE